MTATTVALSASFVRESTGGIARQGDLGREFSSVTIDSRRVAPGSLFVALKGDRFDGHAFVAAAVRAGAAGVLVSETVVVDEPAVVIQVPDTLVALQALARSVRRASGAAVVAITGSAGKTTTKEVTADLLARRYRVRRTVGNLNNHIGLPLSLLDLTSGPDIAVVELGMNHAGEIRTLVGIAEPDVRVWTNVGDAHIGAFGSKDAVAAAKAEILDASTPETRVVANADDPWVMRHVRQGPARRTLFGFGPEADVRAIELDDRGFDGVSCRVVTPAGELALQIPLPGRVHVANVLAAVATATLFDVRLGDIETAVAALRPVARRGASRWAPQGWRVIDDSYNASPAAVIATIDALVQTATNGRRVAVLGEMLELGEQSQPLHASCGRAVAEARVDILVAIGGPVVDALVEAALASGMPRDRVARFTTSVEAASAIDQWVRPGDLVLVKGSRGTRTDLVADRLAEAA